MCPESNLFLVHRSCHRRGSPAPMGRGMTVPILIIGISVKTILFNSPFLSAQGLKTMVVIKFIACKTDGLAGQSAARETKENLRDTPLSMLSHLLERLTQINDSPLIAIRKVKGSSSKFEPTCCNRRETWLSLIFY